VSAYIIRNKHRHPVLRDVIVKIQTTVESLHTEKITALVFAASLIGETPWRGLPSMFRKMNEANRAEVLLMLDGILV
jgi:hypothetical protein